MDANLEKFFEKCQNVLRTLNNISLDNSFIITQLKTDKQFQIMALSNFYHLKKTIYKDSIIELLKFEPSLSSNVEFAHEVLKNDISLLNSFSKIENHPRIKLVTLIFFPSKINEFKDWQTVKKIILAVRFNPIVYRYLNEKFKNNTDVIKAAITNTVFYPEKMHDKSCGMFLDIPTKYQKDMKIKNLALHYFPSLFKLLPDEERNNDETIKIALKKGFYEKDMSAFYELQNIIPYINNKFYLDIKNVKWIMQGFENNIEEANLYTDCAMLIFCCFIRESSKNHPIIKEFFEKTSITSRFEKMLEKHQFKLYSDDLVPTGIEPEVNRFFNEVFPQLSNNLERFLLSNKMEKDLSFNEANEKRTKI